MIRASIFAMLLAPSAGVGVANPVTHAHNPVLDADASSSGWIDFTPHKNLGIYLPITVNGHEATAWLWGGPTSIDKNFAESIGLLPSAPAEGSSVSADVRVGNLTLRDASAKLDELQSQAYAPLIGQPLTFKLGEDVFDQFVVDIDFAHHRVAFRDPERQVKPVGAIEVPLLRLDGERVVPLSIDSSAPAQFELELGNMNGPLLVTPAYAKAHKLLESHATSQRLSGPFSEAVVSVDRLGFAGVDFRHAPIAIIPDTDLPPASIAGGVGLPILSHYRLIIDYTHSRIYAIPNAAAATTPIAKDRIGLILAKKTTTLAWRLSLPTVPPRQPALRRVTRLP